MVQWLGVLASSVVDHGASPDQVKSDYKIGICCFSAKDVALTQGERAKTGWLGIRTMCPSGGRHVYPRTVVSVS